MKIKTQDSRTRFRLVASLTLIRLLLLMPAEAYADTPIITIGSSHGILWEGLPWTFSEPNKPLNGTASYPRLGLLAVSSISFRCLDSANYLRNIGGYMAFPLPGTNNHIGLIPRASGEATWTNYDGSAGSMTGTIGLPKTEGHSSVGGTITEKSSYPWCLPPQNVGDVAYFFNIAAPRTASASGTWVLVGDGQQTAGQINMPVMYFGSYSSDFGGDSVTSILPAGIKLRISAIACTVNSPEVINFGKVLRITQEGAELVQVTTPLTVACTGNTEQVDTNVNIQLQAGSGLYNSDPTKLSLTQGGGYITGEIKNVTGSGECTSSSGVKFDSSKMIIGTVPGSVPDKSFDEEVIWRLCSGGKSLPTGNVGAHASMVVTVN